MTTKKTKQLAEKEQEELLKLLQKRFEKHMSRHKNLSWEKVEARLKADPSKLWSLRQMEDTGGEPDVVEQTNGKEEITFIDCAAESPKGRRSLCYDREALEARKENKPKGNAVDMAAEMGIDLLDEEQYRELQKLGEFDLKTSSWVKTPGKIRDLGGAVFCDRRYDQVFLYHNGAQSYYAARGFRGLLKI